MRTETSRRGSTIRDSWRDDRWPRERLMEAVPSMEAVRSAEAKRSPDADRATSTTQVRPLRPPRAGLLRAAEAPGPGRVDSNVSAARPRLRGTRRRTAGFRAEATLPRATSPLLPVTIRLQRATSPLLPATIRLQRATSPLRPAIILLRRAAIL